MQKHPAMAVSLPATSTRLNPTRAHKLRVLGRDRSLPHLGRKFYHFVMGMVCFSLYAFVLTREQALMTLAVVGGVWVMLDFFRLRSAWFNALALRYVGKLMRREELKSLTGNTFYILGMITIVYFFPKPIVLLSVLYLAIGDPIAAVIGTMWGRHRLVGKKSLEGALANLACTAFATAVVALAYFGFGVDHALALAAFGGLISVAAELTPFPIDDNFTIPVMSAILLSALNLMIPLL